MADMQKDATASCRTSALNIQNLNSRIQVLLSGYVKNKNLELDHLEKNMINMSPEKVLQRGYSITLFKGKAIKNTSELNAGDEIKTIILNGEINSTVKK